MDGSALGTGLQFLAKRKGKGTRSGVRADPSTAECERQLGKLDDLADSLMQGMAWVKWEENRREVLEMGEKSVERFCT